MKNQITILATVIFTTVQPTLTMNPARQKELNKALVAAIRSTFQSKSSCGPEIQRLLDAGADPNAREESKDSQSPKCPALQIAAMYGDEAACKLLLEHNANVNATDRLGFTPLMSATHHTKICKLLLAHSAQVNVLNISKYNALDYAITSNAEVCILLLEHNADATIRSTSWFFNDTPLLKAVKTICSTNESTCTAIVGYYQNRINIAIRTTLLCLNRIRQNSSEPEKIRICAGELYRQFTTLLLPHMKKNAQLKRLLNMRDNNGKKAYDYLQIPCLDPASVDRDEPEDDTEVLQTHNQYLNNQYLNARRRNVRNNRVQQSEQCWCSIQ